MLSSTAKPFLFLSLMLFMGTSVCGVKCTMEQYNPCRCVLSEGYKGIVDLTPIFQRSSLVLNSEVRSTTYTITLNPCLAKEHQYAVSWTRTEPHPYAYYYGNIGNVTREFEFSAFSVEEDKFEFTLIYWHYDVEYSLLLQFVYDPLVVRRLEIIAVGYVPGGPIEPDGMELKVVSQYVKPLLFLEGDSLAVGPYTLEQDVCAGWNGETAFISELGLLSLITPVISLNSTYSSSPPEYHLGVCVNPLKGSDTADDCFAVSRTPVYGGGHVDACIGRSIQAHVVDQRDQGWIVLRYPYGDYFSGCKDYAVTEILFTCDHSDQLTALYPENEFWYACRYQFIWPSHLACPNVTSPSESPSPSNVSSILLGMSGSIAVLLLLVLVGVSLTSCYICRRQKNKVFS